MFDLEGRINDDLYNEAMKYEWLVVLRISREWTR